MDGKIAEMHRLLQERMGCLSLSGPARIVDWLVEMKRLSQADMLDARLTHGRVTKADVRRIGDLIGRFYAACTPEITDGGLYLRHLSEEQAINRTVLERPELDVADAARPVLDAVDRALETLTPKIKRRIAEGRIVEGHGDLRPNTSISETPCR